MAFVNISLLLGGLLASIPIILHLVLRQQPKRLSFPALRFLKERQETNRRQLQLRQWLLLLLRCAAIGLLTLALARPSVASAAIGRWLLTGLLTAVIVVVVLLAVLSAVQRRGKWLAGGLTGLAILLTVGTTVLLASALRGGSPTVLGDQQAPVAAVLVFDTSPRMEYRFHNQTRLELAKETGLWLLRQFPLESSVAVMESRPAPPFFCVDLAAAKGSVERTRVTGTPEPLPGILTRALDLIKTSDKSRKEVYVFTDLAEAAWKAELAATLRAKLAADPSVLIYVIDVGVDQPRNVSLGSAMLSSETLVKSSELSLGIDVTSQNAAGEFTIELFVELPDPSRPIVVDGKPLLPVPILRDRKSLTLSESASQHIALKVSGLEEGTQQGFLRLLNEDGLPSDNVRYFAVEVRSAWSVLLVAPENVNTFLLAEALAPLQDRETGKAEFECHTILQPDMPNEDLSKYSIVCLNDPRPLLPPQWEQLHRYVSQGGSLLVFLGHNAQDTATFNEPIAQRLLGAKLTHRWRGAAGELFLAPRSYSHPALAGIRDQASSAPWSDGPVYFHWSLDERAADTTSIVEFNNGKPALLERPVGAGRVVIMTTPIAEEARPAGRSPWNELLTSDNPWPSFVLLNDLMKYLATGKESRLNYLAGETANLMNDPTRHPPRYQLFTPLDEPQDVVPRDGVLTIPFTEYAGAYRLKGQQAGPVVRGFAVNLAADTSNLTRLSRGRLDELLGAERYRYARSRDEIVLEVGEARVGREFYPYLVLVLVVVLGLEHTLANRFYRKDKD